MVGAPPNAILLVPMSSVSAPSAIDRTLDLLDPALRPTQPQLLHGYLDLLDDADPTGPHPGQRWMASRTLPLIYEHLWRPLGRASADGPYGPGDAR